MSTTIDAASKERPVIVITRWFDAPRPLVWTAITTPAHVAQWYGGPGFTSPVCEMDLRPGGAWRHVMQAPSGAQFKINSIFEEVAPPERLVWRTLTDPDRDPAPPGNHTTITLAEQGAGTTWTMVARFDSFADRDLTASMGFGQMIGMGLDRMADVLGCLAAAPSR